MKCLVLAAHPDDEIYGAGGTIARYTQMGAEVYVVILTEGCSTQYPGQDGMKERKRREALAANQIIGTREVIFYELPDMKLDTLAHVEINRIIEDCIKKLKPAVVFTHHHGDVNKDHRLVFDSTLVAVRPVAGCPVKKLYTYEVPSSTEWATGAQSCFIPNTYFDISPVVEQKIAAIKAYSSELRPFPHPRSEQAVRLHHQCRGVACSMKYAEAFTLIRELGF
ncbi:MAG: PIG-L family deacetylase [Desulfotomaculaceae bacterium]|nr:PIG-L family deacetylase [Desulfotomaculaceae bacterium]